MKCKLCGKQIGWDETSKIYHSAIDNKNHRAHKKCVDLVELHIRRAIT